MAHSPVSAALGCCESEASAYVNTLEPVRADEVQAAMDAIVVAQARAMVDARDKSVVVLGKP